MKLLALAAGAGTYLGTKDFFLSVIASIAGAVLVGVIWLFLSHLKKKKLLNSGIHQIDTMDGIQFEHYLKELFKSMGYSVQLTAKTGDFGADLLLTKEGRKVVVQAKRYAKSVGIKAVQEVVSAIKYYGAEEAWVVTNSNFTKAAVELANTHEVKLIKREDLVQMINQLNPQQKPNPGEIKRTIKADFREVCTNCGSPMVLRSSPKGVFFGCQGFPKCTFTKQAK